MPVPFFSTSLLTPDQCDELAALFAKTAGAEVTWQTNEHGSIGFYSNASWRALGSAVVAHSDAHRRMYQSRPGASADLMGRG